jgi:hypothetical protein
MLSSDAVVDVLTDEELTEEELTELALAADRDAALPDDARCLWDVIEGPGRDGVGLLPGWYMPAPVVGGSAHRRRWRRPVAILLVASFLLVDALGLCITYGQLVIA